jgi:hypothetical protein
MNVNLKTACVRIARAGIKLANEGDFAGAQALVKTADLLLSGNSREQVLNALFDRQSHAKVAAAIDEIAFNPSDVALYKQAMLTEAKQELLKEAMARKEAAKKCTKKKK